MPSQNVVPILWFHARQAEEAARTSSEAERDFLLLRAARLERA